MFDTELTALAEHAARRLRERHETIAVAESSGGGLISASLLSIPGASAYYVGGTVTYTRVASEALLAGAVAIPPGLRGETEEYALHLAHAAAARLQTTWAIGETGAAGPSGSRYGDPAGHVVGRGHRGGRFDPASAHGLGGSIGEHGRLCCGRPRPTGRVAGLTVRSLRR